MEKQDFGLLIAWKYGEPIEEQDSNHSYATNHVALDRL